MSEEIVIVAEFCKKNLDLKNIQKPNEYGYSSLPLCVIDAVFSIGANYKSTKNTVDKFCKYFQVKQTSETHPPDVSEQLSIARFVEINVQYGVEGMAKDVYRNSQRTSTKNGILKAEAVAKFSETLMKFGADYLQDLGKILGKPEFESAIEQIPGQRSGLSLRYFYMLAGEESYVKPDRMVMRFIQSAIGRYPSMDEAHEIVAGACEMLAKENPALTSRLLDHQIWLYQREKKG